MEKAIQKAIEGGWNPRPKKEGEIKLTMLVIEPAEFSDEKFAMFSNPERTFSLKLGSIYSDPLFWQALGKAMGWKDWFYSYYIANSSKVSFNGHWEEVQNLSDVPERFRGTSACRKHSCINQEYRNHWHNFIDHLAEGKDAESFFAELLGK